VPLRRGEGQRSLGRGQERPPGVWEEPARHLPPMPAPRPWVETGAAHTATHPAVVRGFLPLADKQALSERCQGGQGHRSVCPDRPALLMGLPPSSCARIAEAKEAVPLLREPLLPLKILRN
jgi:hypothetical protein